MGVTMSSSVVAEICRSATLTQIERVRDGGQECGRLARLSVAVRAGAVVRPHWSAWQHDSALMSMRYRTGSALVHERYAAVGSTFEEYLDRGIVAAREPRTQSDPGVLGHDIALTLFSWARLIRAAARLVQRGRIISCRAQYECAPSRPLSCARSRGT